MIFWILLAIVIILTTLAVISSMSECYNTALDHLLFGGGTLLVCAFVGGLIFVACASWIPWNVDAVKDDTHHLKALGNSSAIEGRSYFLGGGYIGSKRVLNFISQQDGGAIHVEQAEADKSTIFEGAKDATVEMKHFDHVNGWVSPWPIGSHDEYTFRIPAGSVAESYTLDNAK